MLTISEHKKLLLPNDYSILKKQFLTKSVASDVEVWIYSVYYMSIIRLRLPNWTNCHSAWQPIKRGKPAEVDGFFQEIRAWTQVFRVGLIAVSPDSEIFYPPCPFLLSFLLLSWRALRSYRPHLETKDPIWGDDWSHSLHRRSPSWSFPEFSSAVRQMPGDLCTAPVIIS